MSRSSSFKKNRFSLFSDNCREDMVNEVELDFEETANLFNGRERMESFREIVLAKKENLIELEEMKNDMGRVKWIVLFFILLVNISNQWQRFGK